VVRAGWEGESYESLRGPFNLEGRPLLVDPRGPCDTPITGNVRVKVEEGTRRAWLVAYLPTEALGPDEAGAVLEDLVGQVVGITLHAMFGSESA
jgi:DNA/RNA-binding domain of Phe-tRNA-synthetase-like protein